jgi:hypothetical protein
VFKLPAENHCDFRPQRGLAQLDGEPLNIALGNFAHFGLAERGDFVELEALATERIAQRISSFASRHHIVNKHKIAVRRRFQRREHCRVLRKADRFADLANTSLFGCLCCGQRRRPSIDHSTAEFRRKSLRENERDEIRPACGRCDKKNVFAVAEVLKVAWFQEAVDELKN